MKRSFIVIFLLLFGAISFTFACDISNEIESNNAKIFALDSSVYDDMDALYSLCNMVRPSTNRPWSVAETKLILSRIDTKALEGYSLKLYNKILAQIEDNMKWHPADDLGITVGLDVSLEAYAHSNTDSFVTETDWEHSYDARKSLLRLFVELTGRDNFYFTTDIHWRYRRADKDDRYGFNAGTSVASYSTGGGYNLYLIDWSKYFASQFTTNFFTDTKHFSFIWPRRAVFSFGGSNWNFSYNRDLLSLGNANFGNLLVDDHTFSDFTKLSFFGNTYKFDSVFIFLNPCISTKDNTANTDGRIYLIHTLQFRIANRISFTVSENVVYKYTSLDLTFFNPAFIYHNLNNRTMFNALAYIDFNALLFKGLELYGQFVLDQAQAPNESGRESNANGFLVGLKYSKEIKDGILGIYVEYVKTMPLLYRRDIVDFVRVTRYYVHEAPIENVYHLPFFDYVGFPYGGDCRVLEIKASYSSINDWDASVFSRFAQKGEVNIFYSHNKDGNNSGPANLPGDTPYGDEIKYFAVCGIIGNANLDGLFSWPKVSFNAELNWVGRFTYQKSTGTSEPSETDIQLTLGFTLGI